MIDQNKKPLDDQAKYEVPVVEPVVEPKEKKPEPSRIIVDEVKQV